LLELQSSPPEHASAGPLESGPIGIIIVQSEALQTLNRVDAKI
jgi:hypothetical protein